jgi:DNA-binding NarL/FixJ family response regulator
MNRGAHILVVSRDQMLLQTRALILGAYFQVESAGRIPEAELAMSRIDFDLVVVCYSLPDDEYRKLMDLVAVQGHRPKVLILNNAVNGRIRGGADGETITDSGPYQLLKKAAEMVGFPLKPMGRAARGEAEVEPAAD